MPPLGLPERVQALETAILQERARRLALLIAIHEWLTAEIVEPPDNPVFIAFQEFLEERIAEEE